MNENGISSFKKVVETYSLVGFQASGLKHDPKRPVADYTSSGVMIYLLIGRRARNSLYDVHTIFRFTAHHFARGMVSRCLQKHAVCMDILTPRVPDRE